MENSSDCDDIGNEFRAKVNGSTSISQVSLGSSQKSVSLSKMGSFSPSKMSDKSSLRRNRSYGNMLASGNSEAKVLVIYTGGTIGMMRNEKNGKIFKIIQLHYVKRHLLGRKYFDPDRMLCKCIIMEKHSCEISTTFYRTDKFITETDKKRIICPHSIRNST